MTVAPERMRTGGGDDPSKDDSELIDLMGIFIPGAFETYIVMAGER